MKIRHLVSGTALVIALVVPASAQDFFLPSAAEETAASPDVTAAEPAPAYESAPPTYAAPVAVAPVAAPAPPKEPAVVDEEVTGERSRMSVLRGNAYGVAAMNNVAAALTVNRAISWPHTFVNTNMAYVEPANKRGTAAFGAGSFTAILSLQNFDNSNGLTSFGLASSSWGLVLQLGLEKEWSSRKNIASGAKTTGSFTGRGDYVGAIMSFPLGDLQLAVNAGWLTTRDENNSDNGVTERTEDHYNIVGGVALSNYINGADGLQWEVGLRAGRYELVQYVTTGGTKNTIGDPDANFGILLSGKFGSKVLAKEDARLLVGLNSELWTSVFDKITNEIKNHYDFGINIAPNLVGEIALGKYWVAYAGVSHQISFELSYADTLNGTATTADDVTEVDSWLLTGRTLGSTGVRFATNRFAVEAGLADQLYTDGLSALFSTNGGGLTANFGAMVMF